MVEWKCRKSGFIYDEEVEGVKFNALPEGWNCPECDAPKSEFERFDSPVYDLIIIGGGPAGLSAAIYARRYRLRTLLLHNDKSELIGAHLVENWPGDLKVSGLELIERMKAHAGHFSADIRNENVMHIRKEGTFKVRTVHGGYESRALIVATGTMRRKLGVPGESELLGKGVSYCAACDAAFFRDKDVFIVGGSDAAATEALLLAEYARKVYIVYRKGEIRAEPITKERIGANPKIEIMPNTQIAEIKGNDTVESAILDNGTEFKIDGIFVEIGGVPGSSLAKALGAELNKKNEVITSCTCETSVPGLFAAGDVTDMPFKQAITASSQGVIAAFSAYNYLKKGSVN